MASSVQIANLALASIGSTERITSLADNTPKAILCNLLFEDTVREVIMQGSWTSALRRANLPLLAEAPEWGFTSQFQLPVNPKLLKLLEINEQEVGLVEHSVENNKLLIDQTSVKIKYVAEITDTESFDEYLKQAIVYKLASNLALPVTGDKRLAEAKEQQYQQVLRNNLALNNQQGSIQSITQNDLINVRG